MSQQFCPRLYVGSRCVEELNYSSLMKSYRKLKDWKQAIKYCEVCLGIAKDKGNRDEEGKLYIKLGHFYRDHKQAILLVL